MVQDDTSDDNPNIRYAASTKEALDEEAAREQERQSYSWMAIHMQQNKTPKDMFGPKKRASKTTVRYAGPDSASVLGAFPAEVKERVQMRKEAGTKSTFKAKGTHLDEAQPSKAKKPQPKAQLEHTPPNPRRNMGPRPSGNRTGKLNIQNQDAN
jgi:hypothetical protein